jgi:hypothetical protein
MTVEIPMLTAVIARAAEPEINLAAWGVTFMVTLILGSPVMMFLSASTALSKDWNSYLSLRRYALIIIGLVTLLHLLLALTPLYNLFVSQLIGVPPEVVEPARLGLFILIPWAAAVGYRRFNYGVLIRFGRSRTVTVGAGIRLISDLVMISLFYLVGGLSGIVMATLAFCVGVMIEAIYSEWQVRPILRDQLRQAPPVVERVTWQGISSFLYSSGHDFALTSCRQSGCQRRHKPDAASLRVTGRLAGGLWLAHHLHQRRLRLH